MDLDARHVLVSGRVQGVGFRWSTRLAAESFGVAGWVRNLPDGRVEAWVEGAPEAVAALLAWLGAAPRPARVDGLEVVEREPQGLEGFETRR